MDRLTVSEGFYRRCFCYTSSLSTIRYQDAIDKYESVMKTEPNVPLYTNLAKERICFCLVKVSNNHHLFITMMTFFIRIKTRVSAEQQE